MVAWIMKDFNENDHHNTTLTEESSEEYARWVCKYSKENDPKFGHKYDLNEEWMMNLFGKGETHWHTDTTDNCGSWGVTSMMVKTAQQEADRLKLKIKVTPTFLRMNPEICIRLGCSYFRVLLDSFKGDYMKATMAYNWGASRIRADRLNGLEYFNTVFQGYWKYQKYKEGRK